MTFWKSLTGMLEVEFTSAEPEQSLDRIAEARIQIFQVVQKSDLTYTLQVSRTDLNKLRKLLDQQGNMLRVVRKIGLYWHFVTLVHRPVLLLCLTLTLCCSLYLPSRILFITVEGNETIPSRRILSSAEECGIRLGSSRKQVRSEKVKNALLSAVPELQWAGVNTSGCVATITVRERKEVTKPSDEKIISNIIADRDGYVISSVIVSGNGLVHPGETVKKGQVLISGYTDCGTAILTTRAEGEVFAQTNRKITSVTPIEHSSRIVMLEKRRRYSLLIGKKRINFWKYSRISDGGCVRMYEEYYVTLPGGFQLPIAICVDQYIDYELRDSVLEELDAQVQLQQFTKEYLNQQMVAGQITKMQQNLTIGDRLYTLNSDCTCIEMIGKEQREQIGDRNE